MTVERALMVQKAAAAPSGDTYWPYVSLLLHGDGTNGAQNNTFIDSSTNALTITRNGSATQGSFSPFDPEWSNNFSSSTSDYLSVADSSVLSIGNGTPCTLECFVFTASASNLAIWDKGGGFNGWNTTNGRYYWLSPANFQYYNGGTSNTSITISSFPLNQWVHVAVGYDGTTVRVWVNGTSAGSSTNTWAPPPTTVNINRVGVASSGSYNFTGYISNFRIVNGTDVYGVSNTTITVPTTPLTAITNTALLTCQSNRFKDNSANNLTITPSGSPKVQSFSPFSSGVAYSTATNGGSAYLNGSTDYLSAPYSSGFNLSTNNFTIEAWIYFGTVASGYFVIGNYNSASTFSWSLYTTSTGALSYYLSSNGTSFDIASGVSMGTITVNQWYHVALVRNGSTFTPYLNGVAGTTATSASAIYNGSVPIYFGKYIVSGPYFLGYISNFRLVNGTAVYTSNFTPPTSPLTAITNTQLLLNTVNAGIVDNAMQNDLVTTNTAQISTAQSKFGTGSLYFNGSSLAYASSITSNAYGNFTVECFIYATSFASYGSGFGAIITTADATNNQGYNLGISSTAGYLQILMGNGSAFISAIATTNAIAFNTWYHVALVRNGNTYTGYVNGTSVVTVTSSTAPTYTNNRITVGGRTVASQYFTGYIDEVRITNGVARYTSNFTPPTQAFPNY